MPVKLNGQTFYRTNEVYRLVGISRSTLFRWLKQGVLKEVERRDRRGWRLFSEDEVKTIKTEANRVFENSQTK